VRASAVATSLFFLLACSRGTSAETPSTQSSAVASEALESSTWSSSLSSAETTKCKQVAWQAAESSEMHAKFKLKRVTSEPIVLSEARIEYDVDQADFSKVEVVIPSGGHVGWHPTFIGVTLARGTYEVLAMREGCWL